MQNMLVFASVLAVGLWGTPSIFADDKPSTEKPIETGVGAPAPAFKSIDERGRPWDSADHFGKRFTVLYFYPADFTTGCSRQAETFRDTINELADYDVDVVGVSGDAVRNHQLFKRSWNLNYTLLADEAGEVAKMFGVPVSAGGQVIPFGPDRKPLLDEQGEKFRLTRQSTLGRWTFLIGSDGKVLYRNTRVQPADDAQQILKFMQQQEHEESYKLVDATAQQQAVTALKALGATFEVDEASPVKPVISLQFVGCRVRDEDLLLVKSLPALRTARIGHGTTDAGLEHLASLSYLESLSIPGAQIKGPGLKHLAGLTRLHELDIEQTQIDDAALVHLKGLDRLRTLNLAETEITLNGLNQLATLTHLESLNLYYVFEPLDDRVASSLMPLAHLKFLDLSGSALTDTGLESIQNLKVLKKLNLEMTQVTASGIERFKKARPQVEVKQSP